MYRNFSRLARFRSRTRYEFRRTPNRFTAGLFWKRENLLVISRLTVDPSITGYTTSEVSRETSTKGTPMGTENGARNEAGTAGIRLSINPFVVAGNWMTAEWPTNRGILGIRHTHFSSTQLDFRSVTRASLRRSIRNNEEFASGPV